ncbi:MAG: hypothetical protein ABI882_12330 [Acidobacteriota bacterium]
MALFFVLFVLGAGVALLAAIAAAFTGRTRTATGSLVFLFIWTGLYLGAVGWSSYSSKPNDLAPHEEYRLRGFMLDPHFLFSVDQVRQTDRLPSQSEVLAKGAFYVVSLRYRSDAARAVLHPPGLDASVVDASGRVTRPIEPVSDMPPLGPSQSGVFDGVFDLPRDVREPRLLLRSNEPLDRWLGRVIIDDEESVGHSRTSFQLPPHLVHSNKGE